MTTRAIDFVFFDIGGTLGDRDPHSGDLVPFPSTIPMLTSMRDVLGMRIGVITTLGTLTRADGLQLLRKSGLEPFIDPNGFISEHDNAGTGKPSLAIYKFAADRVGVPVNRCMFIGENLIEVAGAIAAGMQALLKPSPPGKELR